MPAAWETWTLLWFAALQFAVAYWWWRGPFLEGTRGIVAVLFALNGVVTLRGVLQPFVAAEAPLRAVAGLADNFTLVMLVLLGTVGIDVGGGLPRVRRVGGGTLLAGYVLLSPFWVLENLGMYTMPAWNLLATTGVQLLAGILVATALVRRLETDDSLARDAWLLVLAGVGLRFAEFSMAELFPNILIQGPKESIWVNAQQVLRIAMATVIVVALIQLIRAYFEDEGPGPVHDMSLALLLGGLMLGAGRTVGGDSWVALIFSFAFPRPLAFTAGQARLTGSAWREESRVEELARGALLFAGSLVAVQVGATWLGNPLAAMGFGAALTVMGIPVARRIEVLPGASATPRRADQTEAASPGKEWPVEDERVALPDDWRDELERRERTYQELPGNVRKNLDGLSRWQRIVLALEGAPDGGDLPAYERTTPGLHYLTHCPYSNIGPNISRANDRWEKILEELNVDGPDLSPGGEPLIEGSWGRAEGLDSPRVKWYELTDLGEEVAARLREEVGLADRNPQDVALLVGEGFGEA